MVGYSPLDSREKRKVDSLGYEGSYEFALWPTVTGLGKRITAAAEGYQEYCLWVPCADILSMNWVSEIVVSGLCLSLQC